MTKIRALLLLLLIMTACFVVALPALWMDLFSSWVGLLILVGIFVFGGLLGLLAARWLIGNRRTEAAQRLQQRQAIIVWASAAAAVVGVPLSTSGHEVVAVVGLVITFACMCVVWWALLRAVPPKADRDTPDGGHYQI